MKILRALAPDHGAKAVDRNPLLRLTAQGNKVSIRINDVEAGCEAEVTEPGVSFLRSRKLLPLARTYGNELRLTVSVTTENIQIGHTWISAELWEVSFFPDPSTAPAQLFPKNATSRGKQRGRGRKRDLESESPRLL